MQNKKNRQYVLDFQQKVLQIHANNFLDLAQEAFDFQINNNQVFKDYYLKTPNFKNSFTFLPISAFKHYALKCYDFEPKVIFKSSGTTGTANSMHHIDSVDFYHQLSFKIFEKSIGHIESTVILALLPSYLEQGQSSLVHMVNHFVEHSNEKDSGFFLYDFDALYKMIENAQKSNKNIVLFGVSYALLDFVDWMQGRVINYTKLTIIETGGMKGRRKEMTREELHAHIQIGFPNCVVSSEYGMTELLSQAYLNEEGWFEPPPSMKVFAREINDPFAQERYGKIGVLNIIDLANIHSQCFIATDDLGILREDGCFKVLGRLDNSDLRGCNLLVS